jgi:hypothetical protein
MRNAWEACEPGDVFYLPPLPKPELRTLFSDKYLRPRAHRTTRLDRHITRFVLLWQDRLCLPDCPVIEYYEVHGLETLCNNNASAIS